MAIVPSPVSAAELELQKQFLLHYMRSGNEGRACKAIGIPLKHFREWCKNENFVDKLELTKLDLVGSIEEVAWGLAQEGHCDLAHGVKGGHQRRDG